MRLLHSDESGAVEGTSAALAGLGALTYAFFPLAIPIVSLTAVALLPLVAVVAVAGLVVAIAASPLLLVRSVRRRLHDRATGKRAEGDAPRPSQVAVPTVMAPIDRPASL